MRCTPLISKTLLTAAASSLALICTPTVSGQTQTQLQITSPAPGTIVNPGQTVNVSVSSPAGTSFGKVAIVAEDPLTSSSVGSSVPAQLTISVPTAISPGPYMLSAVGTTTGGTIVKSSTILIDVERTDMPTSISAAPPRLRFRSLGQRASLSVSAAFPDGTSVEVSRSSKASYSSSDMNVATVNRTGGVKAVGPGKATVTISYAQANQTVSTTVLVTVPSAPVTSSPTVLNFNNQNVGTSSPAQTITITNASNNPSLHVGPVAAFGDFTETDNCASSSPLAVGGMCTINIVFTPTVAGSRTGAVNLIDSMDIVAQTVALSGTGIGQQPTTTTVVSSVNPSVFGQSVVLTAVVAPNGGSGTPTGTVTFSDGANSLGSASPSSGQATLSTS